MDDARQALHQRSLRNVRAELDREVVEAERQKRGTRLLLLALIAAMLLAIVALIGVGIFAGPSEAEVKAGICFSRAWSVKSAERRREIRTQSPDISTAELAERLRAEMGPLEESFWLACRAAK